MNNTEHLQNRISSLKNVLELVIKETQSKGYPSFLTLSNANAILSKYMDDMEMWDNEKIGCGYASGIKFTKEPEYDIVMDIKPSAVVSALKKNPDSIDILILIKYQQLIFKNSKYENDNKLQKLIKQGFIETCSISIKEKSFSFYALSPKGMAIFSNQNIWKQVRKHFSNIAIPAWTDDKYNAKRLIQAAVINLYMKQQDTKGYITFSFNEEPDLLFASEIKNNNDIVYYCVFGIDEKKDVDNFSFIRSIIETSDIDCVKCVCVDKVSKKKIEKLKKDNAIGLGIIEICNLEARDGQGNKF